TKEPSNGAFGQLLREAIQGKVVYSPELLALGFAADRIAHMTEPDGIDEALNDGVWVISDRYVLSALAYQSAQGVDLDWLVEINRFAPDPDATVFVDTPVRTCISRILQRDSNQDDIFHRRAALSAIRKEYMRVLDRQRFTGKLITVNGTKPIAAVRDDIVQGLAHAFRNEFGLFAELVFGEMESNGG
ncbi:MAG: dTMP kinase, partial [Eggerthellaceae bacterium]|nr:dTMP kinase [Eggerthellaceae bacterium]